MKTNITCILLACLMACTQFCNATITVGAVNVTTSTCPNNGQAVVHAHSNRNNAVFLYEIVTGPVLYPLQNDSGFLSLYPGSYTGWVHDVNSFDSTSFNFTITGNYQAPVVSATIQAPLCLNGSNGQITGQITPGTGLAPYTWAMFSPYTTAPQQSAVFSGLTAGTYIIRLTDACDISRSVSAVLDTDGTELQLLDYDSYPYLTIISCNTAVLTTFYSIDKNKAYSPLTLTVQTNNGTTVSSIMPQAYDTTDVIPSVFILTDTITGLDFNGTLLVTLTDACGQSISFSPTQMPPFNFGLDFTADSTGCGGYTATINLNYGNNDLNTINDDLPLSVTLTNTATGAVIGSYTQIVQAPLEFGCPNCPAFSQEPDTTEFTLTVSDQCGHFSQANVYWPSMGQPTTYVDAIAPGCLDSTAETNFFFAGFGAVVNLSILSGPTISQSTNPDFAYQNTIIYPAVFSGITSGSITIGNMPPGFYTYQVTDLCGNIYNDTFSVPPIYGLEPTIYNRSNCNGTSTFILNNNYGAANVTLISGPAPLPLQLVDDQYLEATGLLPGPYQLNLQFVQTFGAVPLPGNGGCSALNRTFLVPYYNDSIIRTTDVATCNGDIYLTIQADTNNGPAPFMYQIISGPQTYGLQTSNTFQVSSFGTYLVGATDSCGNEDTRYVTVDTGRFNAPVQSGGLCPGDAVVLSEDASPYFTYSWLGPDDVTHNGNPIIINPFVNSDTGNYIITRYVNINGCSSSSTGTFHIGYFNQYYQTVTQCPLDTLWVGTHAHMLPGVYTDTLSGAHGCDSIEITTLRTLPALNVSITGGDSVSCYSSYLILVGTGADNYNWLPYNYPYDTLYVTTANAMVYTVIGYDNTGTLCPGRDSITVYPVTDSLQLLQNYAITCGKGLDTICVTSGFASYLWSNGSTDPCLVTFVPGAYTVTATSASGCTVSSDTALIVEMPLPVINQQGSALVCTGGYYNYQWLLNGDTIPGATGTSYIITTGGTYSVEVSDSGSCPAISNNVIIASVNTVTDNTSVWIYPNPATDQLYIKTENIQPVSITIYDADGRLIYTMPFTPTVNINQLSSGVYFVEVTSNEGVARKRFVKM